jgi:methylmalonyl-CoA mutase
MSNSKENRLFEEFSPVSREEWEALIQKDLKGADYHKKLVWKTLEGFDIKPYYRLDDIEKLDTPKAVPGEFPFVRGKGKKGQNWLIRQDIQVDSVKKAAEKALKAISKGAQSVGFILDRKLSKEEVSQLLEKIDQKITEVNFLSGENGEEILEGFLMMAGQSEMKASLDYDPLVHMAVTGKQYAGDPFVVIEKMISKTSRFPGLKVINVNAHHFQNAGSSLVQELAFALSAGNEYISKLTEKGLKTVEVASKMKFSFAAGSNYFMEIAKIRAARLLWAKLVEAWGGSKEAGYMHIHSVTARFNKSIYDPYVNMLRTSTESMSAILGGADSVTTEPFDVVFRKETGEIAERIARNTQIVLREEVYLDKIADPAAGSYYIESLTASVAEEAWKLFLITEEKGGFSEALKQGFIQEKIEETAKTRIHNIANRLETILGTNQYPNQMEKVSASIDKNIFEPEGKDEAGLMVKPLRLFRGSEEMEKMRLRTERLKKQPVVFLLTYGNVTMRRARAGFASNFFGCAGFKVIDNIGFASVEEGLKAAKQAGADLVVLCSSDEEYSEGTVIAGKDLKNKSILVIAGYPKDSLEQLKTAGAKYFIHVRSNVLETLSTIQQELGIQ